MFDLEKVFNFNYYFNKMKKTYSNKSRYSLINEYLINTIKFYDNLDDSYKESSKNVFNKKIRELLELSLYDKKGKIDIWLLINLWSNNYDEILFGWDEKEESYKGLAYKRTKNKISNKDELYSGCFHDKKLFIRFFNLIESASNLTYKEKIHNLILLLGFLQSTSFKNIKYIKQQSEIFKIVLSLFNESHPKFEKQFGKLNEDKIYPFYLLLCMKELDLTNSININELRINEYTVFHIDHRKCIKKEYYKLYHDSVMRKFIEDNYCPITSIDKEKSEYAKNADVYYNINGFDWRFDYRSSYMIVFNFLKKYKVNSLKLYETKNIKFLIDNDFIDNKNLYELIDVFNEYINTIFSHFEANDDIKSVSESVLKIFKIYAKEKYKLKKNRTALINVLNDEMITNVWEYGPFIIEKFIKFLEKDENKKVFKLFKSDELKDSLNKLAFTEQED